MLFYPGRMCRRGSQPIYDCLTSRPCIRTTLFQSTRAITPIAVRWWRLPLYRGAPLASARKLTHENSWRVRAICLPIELISAARARTEPDGGKLRLERVYFAVRAVLPTVAPGLDPTAIRLPTHRIGKEFE